MRVLIIKTSALGDIVQTFGAVRFIKELYPNAVIDWVVEKSSLSLIKAHPDIAHIHMLDTKKWRKSWIGSWREIQALAKQIRRVPYDIAFDFQGNFKSGLVMGLSRAKAKVGFGRKTVAEFPNLFFTNFKVDPKPGNHVRQDYLALVEGWFGQKGELHPTLLKLSVEETALLKQLTLKKGEGRHILVCPGSHWKNKRMSLDNWCEQLKQVPASHIWIIRNGEAEKVFAEELASKIKGAHVLPELSLPLLQHWMKGMDLVMAVDSVPLHLAGETGVATLSFFGPSSSKKYAPLGKQHHIVQGNCPYRRQFEKRCPILRSCKTGACMDFLHDMSALGYANRAGETKKVDSLN